MKQQPLRTQMLNDYEPRQHGLLCEDKTLTQQNFKDDADINIIIKRMGVGITPPFNARIPMQGDFTEVTDFRGALHLTMEAQHAFDQLPAQIRSRFENDPAQFLDFFYDPANTEEAVRLGLAVPRPPEPPKEPQAAPDTAK